MPHELRDFDLLDEQVLPVQQRHEGVGDPGHGRGSNGPDVIAVRGDQSRRVARFEGRRPVVSRVTKLYLFAGH